MVTAKQKANFKRDFFPRKQPRRKPVGEAIFTTARKKRNVNEGYSRGMAVHEDKDGQLIFSDLSGPVHEGCQLDVGATNELVLAILADQPYKRPGYDGFDGLDGGYEHHGRRLNLQVTRDCARWDVRCVPAAKVTIGCQTIAGDEFTKLRRWIQKNMEPS